MFRGEYLDLRERKFQDSEVKYTTRNIIKGEKHKKIIARKSEWREEFNWNVITDGRIYFDGSFKKQGV